MNHSHTFAMAHAVFPSSTSLQPIPQSVQPRISTNLQSTTTAGTNQEQPANQIDQTQGMSEYTATSGTTTSTYSTSPLHYGIYYGLILCFFALFYFLGRKFISSVR